MRQRWSLRWSLIAACLVIAGTALKVHQWYFSRPLWVDEEMVMLNVRDRSFVELATPLWLGQTAPVGWLWLQRAFILTFGTDDRVVRALPVLAGIGTLWAAWWMARRALTPLAGVVLVALCAIGQWVTFYALEVKPYSADAFAAMLLMCLAFWAAEGEEQPLSLRRTAVWWLAAAIAQWFSFGATFVTPACALVLTVAAWRRAGVRRASFVACQGVVWLVCFGAHYILALRAASNDPFLNSFWASGFPPAEGGVSAAAGWIVGRAESIASHPGGTERWVLFWLAAAYGAIALMAKHAVAGTLLVLIPLTGVLLAVARAVPLNDRIAVWLLPAVYAAVAVAAGDLFERTFERQTWRGVAMFALSAVFSVLSLAVAYDVVALGSERLIIRGLNHGFDDARSVRLIARERQTGDVWIAPQFSLPAVWWYGDIPIGEPGRGSVVPSETGVRVFEIVHRYYGRNCLETEPLRDLQETLSGVSRVGVYLGFASNIPEGFQMLVLDRLSRIGARVTYRGYGEGIAAVYDLRQPPDIRGSEAVGPVPVGADSVKTLDGCVDIAPARHR